MSLVRAGGQRLSADIVVFGIAFGFTNLISYLYLVIVGRTLAAADFGVFNALLGLVTLSGFLATSMQLAVTQAAALTPGLAGLAVWMRTTLRFAFPSTALLVLAGMPFAPAIGADAKQVALCGLVVLLMFLGSTALGFLAGIGKIRHQAGITLVGAIARLTSGWVLMLIGWGIAGAVLGYLFNHLVVLIFACRSGSRVVAGWSLESRSEPPELRLDGTAIATFVLAFAPFSLDQLLVQAFAPSLGGNYAALATTAKLVFFAAYPVMAVAYPHMLLKSGARTRARLLAGAVAGVTCIAGGLAWILATFPKPMSEMLFGSRFPQAVAHVGSLAFGVACLSISALGAHALIVWGSRLGFLPSLVALGAGVVLFAVRHDTLATIVNNMVWVYGLQLIMLLALLGLTVRRSLISTAPAAPEGLAT